MNTFDDLNALATHLRQKLDELNTILIFAYNGVGKTLLSMKFKDQGKQRNHQSGHIEVSNRDQAVMVPDTLYFNAFTEDLFVWDNDLEGDVERVLRLNGDSSFFKALDELEMEDHIRNLLGRYANFDFRIDATDRSVRFSRLVQTEEGSMTVDNIKISRSEENVFIWCFFLVIVKAAMNRDDDAYSWVRYIYIDDPISSLDENNAVIVSYDLAELLIEERRNERPIKFVISSHHALFFNVISSMLAAETTVRYLLTRSRGAAHYNITNTSTIPFFYHVAMLSELVEASESDSLYKYHFNVLRSIMEKTSNFHGYKNFAHCLQGIGNGDEALYRRALGVFSHGGYSLYDPVEMPENDKKTFLSILNHFLDKYDFNTDPLLKLMKGDVAANQDDETRGNNRE